MADWCIYYFASQGENECMTTYFIIAVLSLLGLPCMTSVFYLIFVAWLRATRPFRKTHSIHKPITLVIIIVLHFAISIGFDVAAGFTLQAVPLLILCQVCFIIWALVLSTMYFYLYRRIYNTTVKPRKEMRKISLNILRNGEKKNGNEGHYIEENMGHGTKLHKSVDHGLCDANPRVDITRQVLMLISIIFYTVRLLLHCLCCHLSISISYSTVKQDHNTITSSPLFRSRIH